MKKSEEYPYVEVTWDDATIDNTSWVDVEEISQDLERVISRGWLIKENTLAVYLAGSVASTNMKEENVGNLIVIPKGMIVARRELRVSERKQKVVNE